MCVSGQICCQMLVAALSCAKVVQPPALHNSKCWAYPVMDGDNPKLSKPVNDLSRGGTVPVTCHINPGELSVSRQLAHVSAVTACSLHACTDRASNNLARHMYATQMLPAWICSYLHFYFISRGVRGHVTRTHLALIVPTICFTGSAHIAGQADQGSDQLGWQLMKPLELKAVDALSPFLHPILADASQLRVFWTLFQWGKLI